MKPPTYVGPSGPKNAKIVIVGEQPGVVEVQEGRPFVGPAGNELSKCLSSAGIVREKTYITNVIKDLLHPIDWYLIKRSKVIVDFSPDGKRYLEELRQELEEVSPNVVIVLGNVALFALTGKTGITKWRGSILKSTLVPGLKVVASIHPSTIIPPKNVYLNRRLLILDLMRALEESSTREFPEENYELIIRPTANESISYLRWCKELGLKGNRIAFDIEVLGRDVACISFSPTQDSAISIPFVCGGCDYFLLDEETKVWREISSLLSNPEVKKLGQNVIFDVNFLLQKMQIRTRNISDDTMIAHKIYAPDYPAALEFITSIYTKIPYYKADGKQWMKVKDSWDVFWQYNAKDSLVCSIIIDKLLEDLTRQGNLETYQRHIKLIEPLIFMMFRGIKVDIERLNKKREENLQKLQSTRRELTELAGFDLNPNSPQQVANYFYKIKGLKPYVKRGSGGKPTTDDDALKRLARRGYREANLIRRARALRKQNSTYLDEKKFDADGRVRSSYNPAGTKTGRLSSSESIFGTGMNMQNWPRELLSFLVPDDGYVYYAFDLSQVENRIVAYVGGVVQMIKAFEEGVDLHSLTASLIFSKPIEKISDEPGSCELGGGRFSERFWGKKANHSLNYGYGYKSFALSYEIPENEAKWIVERYHTVYAEVRRNYHQMIKESLARKTRHGAMARTLTNLFGRKRVFLDRWGDTLFKEAYAQIPQSTVADKINEHGVIPIYYDQKFREAELLIQVHDSIGFQIPIQVPWKRHAEILFGLKELLEQELHTGSFSFKTPVDLTIGLSLNKSEGKEIKSKDFPSSTDELASILEMYYKELVDGREKEEAR